MKQYRDELGPYVQDITVHEYNRRYGYCTPTLNEKVLTMYELVERCYEPTPYNVSERWCALIELFQRSAIVPVEDVRVFALSEVAQISDWFDERVRRAWALVQHNWKSCHVSVMDALEYAIIEARTRVNYELGQAVVCDERYCMAQKQLFAASALRACLRSYPSSFRHALPQALKNVVWVKLPGLKGDPVYRDAYYLEMGAQVKRMRQHFGNFFRGVP